jgi:hypothetical protein
MTPSPAISFAGASEEKDRQLAAAEEAKIKAEEEFKSELEDFRTHPHGLTVIIFLGQVRYIVYMML